MRIIGIRPPETQARRNRLGYAFTVAAYPWPTVDGEIVAPAGARFRVTRTERLTGNDLRPLNPGGYLVGLVDVEPIEPS